ncbi:hypothetical protein CGP82_05200 [Campylobacter sp. LR185c]|nr:hypothetical protein CGP82_05200 [Campylobacter sp. LR185c]
MNTQKNSLNKKYKSIYQKGVHIKSQKQCIDKIKNDINTFFLPSSQVTMRLYYVKKSNIRQYYMEIATIYLPKDKTCADYFSK